MASFLELTITRGLRLSYGRCISRAAPQSTRSVHLRTCHLSSSTAARANGSCWSETRSFHSSCIRLKKGGTKASKKGSNDAPATASSDGGDPNDFSELQDAISQAHVAFKEALSNLKPGGKFNPALIEGLRVHLDKDSKAAVKVGELAQCIPRGRTLNVIAGEKDHIKAISSAILKSDLNLTPQPDAQNPLQLNIQLPTATAESRQATVKTAQDFAEKANTAVRNARGTQQKKLRSMQVGKAVRPDELKKASDRMEKVVTDGSAEVKRILDSAKRVLESG